MKLKKVMCFGTFDLLHLGHLNYFQQARLYGDYLIVIIARDKTKVNEKKPTIFSEKERLAMVNSLRIVDEAVLGDEQDHFKVIREKNPDVLCLGYDQKITEEELSKKLNSLGMNAKVKKLKPYHPQMFKSSLLKEKITQHL